MNFKKKKLKLFGFFASEILTNSTETEIRENNLRVLEESKKFPQELLNYSPESPFQQSSLTPPR
jgi:hypothetical protein